ncbi:MAG: hypothetical protein QOE65_1991 [Solirubrobacteraceae bacterium]|nr:hypothetical protein [Solirubrobacteraceae bacterium]
MVVATGAAAGVAWQLAAGDTVRDVGVRLDLRERGPLELRLGGPLWRDRTLRDPEGARDVAYVLRDAPLEVAIAGRDGGRPKDLVVAVDGQVAARRRLCDSAPCPAHARLTLTPAVSARGPGLHRLSLRATGTRPRDVAGSTFEVTVGRKLSALEAEPVARRAGPPARPSVGSRDRRRALAVVERERRWGVLRGVLGLSFYEVAQVGRLRGVRGSDVGATLLLSLPVARSVRAQVPAYVPDARAASGFRLRQVTLSAPLLRDLLVDVDLTKLRVVAAEPGPRSSTDGAQGVAGPTPVESPADAPRADPELVRLSDAGPAFMAYDGTASLRRGARDWAVSLIFTGHASVGKVKRALRGLGFTHSGRPSYLPYRVRPGALRFDGDRGVKTGCDRQGTDLHLRLYAPSATDRFVDPEYGDVVVATAHHDRGDGCGHPPALFGFSESAEQRIAGLVSARLGWRVRPDRLALGNPEPYRRDIGDSAHVWWSDGRATLIAVP